MNYAEDVFAEYAESYMSDGDRALTIRSVKYL
jgi:hypothetical protein